MNIQQNKLEPNTITVLVNSYRETEQRFRKAIKSILANTDIDIQIIVSTVTNDPCIPWAREYGANLVINAQPGIYSQINNALPLIRGMYMCYASSNDYMMPHKLHMERKILTETGKKVCYSSYLVEGINGKVKVRNFFDYDYSRHLKTNFVSDCAMVHTPTLLKYTPFELQYKNHAYYHLWLTIFEQEGDVFFYNPTPTWRYIITADSQHYQRKHNEQKRLQNEADRQFMLQKHIKHEPALK